MDFEKRDRQVYPVMKRIFAAQPRKQVFKKAQWIVRPVNQIDRTEDGNLVRPAEMGFSHMPFELYYHCSVVQELREEVRRLRAELKLS